MSDDQPVFLADLNIKPGEGLLDTHLEHIRSAGFDLTSISDLSGVRLYDAAFLTEDIALATLGGNYGRLVASIRNCTAAISDLKPCRVLDLGGGCGAICFEAARHFPATTFVVADRSINALKIGQKWTDRLKLQNILFVSADFSDSTTAGVLGRDYDLVLLEYIFELGSERENEDEVIATVSPALKMAVSVSKPYGKVQVRFGEFSEYGINGLVRAAYRAHLTVDDVLFAEDGCTFRFCKDKCERCEDQEVLIAMDWFSMQLRVADPGD